MKYELISADCHIDFPWLPEDLFTSNCSAGMKDRMPYVEETESGRFWVTKRGSSFGLQNGMGSAGRRYTPGEIHRSDRMAEQGLYRDGEAGVPRLIDPDLRIKDQDLDGVQGEVLYGVLGAAMRLDDGPASVELVRIYNEWLADFCAHDPARFAGIASITSYSIDAAVHEVERVATRGIVRGLEISCTHEMQPLFDDSWIPIWTASQDADLPVHFHTIGPKMEYDYTSLNALQRRQAFAVHITGFQLAMSKVIMELIYGGVLEAFPRLQVVIGESGIGWVPYLLEHMDLEWTDQFKDLTLTMKPSDYWHRQFFATYQSDPIGLRLLDILGEDNVMWGSDFPHPDGIWPDSREFIEREFKGINESTRTKVLCKNAEKLYGFAAYADD